jgi:gamma-glutamyltranspeptidase / glutathione hydrolase
MSFPSILKMKTIHFIAAILAGMSFVVSASPASAQDPGRNFAGSMTVTKYGIVATSQTLASQAGAAVLARGGSAVDAAIAANAALGVIEPMMNGMGGDLFAIVYDAKTKKLYGLNSSGWSPAGMSIATLVAKGIHSMPSTGIDSVSVPGAVAGWDALHRRFGKLPLADDLQPAILYAEQGVPIPETDADNWAELASGFVKEPTFAPVFLPDGHAPSVGQVFRNPDLASSLRMVGEKGRDGFYQGPIADAIVKLSKERGGSMTATDLADFQPQWVDPISTTYHGWTVYEIPPNTQGVAALSMLNIMENFPLRQWGHDSANTLHVEMEAKKLAYADMLHYVGDPRTSDIPTAQLISKSLAVQRAKLIDIDRAHCKVLPSNLKDQLARLSSDTTYLSVVDRYGNEVSLIQSDSGGFGSGLVAPGTGFVLQNRMAGFSLTAGQPNSLAPHKRPLHTIIPGFMRKGDLTMAFGIMGGFNQAQAHAQFVANVVDFDMNIQDALSAARFRGGNGTRCAVAIEAGYPESVLVGLSSKGQLLHLTPRYSQVMGRGNVVLHDSGTGVNFGASDPRADGTAIPEEPPVSRR